MVVVLDVDEHNDSQSAEDQPDERLGAALTTEVDSHSSWNEPVPRSSPPLPLR